MIDNDANDVVSCLENSDSVTFICWKHCNDDFYLVLLPMLYGAQFLDNLHIISKVDFHSWEQ